MPPSEATRRGWKRWREQHPPLVNEKGFDPIAIVRDRLPPLAGLHMLFNPTIKCRLCQAPS